jgi:uncharacterized protein DUF4112
MTKDLERYRALTRLMDEAIRLPIIGTRVGLDPLMGLIPGVGDLAGGVLAAYGLLAAWRAGAPGSVLTRMLLNIGVDTLIGEIPVVGDLFDFGFKSNTRNYRLLEQYLDRPAPTRRESRLLLVALLFAMLALIGAGIWVTVKLAGLILHALGSP